LREPTPPPDLHDPAMAAADQLVGAWTLSTAHEPHPAALEIGEEHGAVFLANDLLQLLEQRGVRLVHPHVDLAAARQAHAQREVVGDPVGQEPGLAASQDLPGGFVDLVLDAAAGDRARELAAFGDRELRADGPRRRSSRRYDACEGDTLTACAPTLEIGQELPHGSHASALA